MWLAAGKCPQSEPKRQLSATKKHNHMYDMSFDSRTHTQHGKLCTRICMASCAKALAWKPTVNTCVFNACMQQFAEWARCFAGWLSLVVHNCSQLQYFPASAVWQGTPRLWARAVKKPLWANRPGATHFIPCLKRYESIITKPIVAGHVNASLPTTTVGS